MSDNEKRIATIIGVSIGLSILISTFWRIAANGGFGG